MKTKDKYESAKEMVQMDAYDVRKWQRNRGFNDRTDLMNALDNAEAGYRNKNVQQIKAALEVWRDQKEDLHPTEKDVIGGFFRQAEYTLDRVEKSKNL